jgi:hypothetical protein
MHTTSKFTSTRELLRVNAVGGFPEPVYETLAQDRALLIAIAQQLLDDHFLC